MAREVNVDWEAEQKTKREKAKLEAERNAHWKAASHNVYKLWCGSVLSGIYIGIAGTVYLMVKDPYLGALLFSCGLLSICTYFCALYTGAVGYLTTAADKFDYLVGIIFIWIGNLVGTFGVGLLVSYTKLKPLINGRVTTMVAAKCSDGTLSLLILGLFCGILMYTAVEGFRRSYHPIIKILLIIFCVMVFILSGFEHCIADMYYVAVAGRIDAEVWRMLFLVTIGNSLGGMLANELASVLKLQLAE